MSNPLYLFGTNHSQNPFVAGTPREKFSPYGRMPHISPFDGKPFYLPTDGGTTDIYSTKHRPIGLLSLPPIPEPNYNLPAPRIQRALVQPQERMLLSDSSIINMRNGIGKINEDNDQFSEAVEKHSLIRFASRVLGKINSLPKPAPILIYIVSALVPIIITVGVLVGTGVTGTTALAISAIALLVLYAITTAILLYGWGGSIKIYDAAKLISKTLKEQSEELTQNLEHTIRIINSLKQNVDRLSTEVDRLAISEAHFADLANQFQAKIKTLEEVLSQKVKELELRNEEFKTRIAEFQNEREKLSKEISDRNAELKQRTIEFGEEREKLSREIDARSEELKKRVAEFGEERERLAKEITDRNEELKKRVSEFGEERELLSKEITSRNEELKKRVTDFEEERERLAKEITDRSEELKNKTAEFGAERERLSGEIDKITEKELQLSIEIDRLKTTSDAYKKELDKFKDLSKDYEKQIVILTKNNEDYQRENKNLKESVSNLSKEIETLKEEIKSFQTEVTKLKENNADYAEKNSELNSSVKALQQISERLSQVFASLVGDGAKLEAFKKAMDDFMEDKELFADAVLGLDNLRDKLEATIEHSKNISDQLENAVEELKKMTAFSEIIKQIRIALRSRNSITQSDFEEIMRKIDVNIDELEVRKEVPVRTRRALIDFRRNIIEQKEEEAQEESRQNEALQRFIKACEVHQPEVLMQATKSVAPPRFIPSAAAAAAAAVVANETCYPDAPSDNEGSVSSVATVSTGPILTSPRQ